MPHSSEDRAQPQVAVSVILPVYNRSRSLRASAESVLQQSFRDLELIIVDDASTEDLEPIVRGLGDDRVRYIRQPVNGGASRARNTGLAAARGRFIAFQDSDDLWLPGRLARQVELLESLPPSVGAVTGFKILYGRDGAHTYGPGRVTCAPPAAGRLDLEEDQVRRFLMGNRISLQNAVFRRDCYPDIRWFDPCAKANADWEFTARLAQHTRVFEEIEPVVLAFISADSISTNSRKKIMGLLRIMKKNGPVLARYPDAHARMQTLMARMLFRIGKRRLAWRFLVAALRTDLGTVVGSAGVGGVLRRRLARA